MEQSKKCHPQGKSSINNIKNYSVIYQFTHSLKRKKVKNVTPWENH